MQRTFGTDPCRTYAPHRDGYRLTTGGARASEGRAGKEKENPRGLYGGWKARTPEYKTDTPCRPSPYSTPRPTPEHPPNGTSFASTKRAETPKRPGPIGFATDATLHYRTMGCQSGCMSLFRLKVICRGSPLPSASLMKSSSSPVGLSTPGPLVRSLEKTILPPPGEKTG